MKRTTKKLAFEKQTVRILRQAELSAVAGGSFNCGTFTCPTVQCQTMTCPTGTCQPTITAYQTGCDSGDYTDGCIPGR